MIYSMTGYGRANGEYGGRIYNVDIRTLNGKNTDIRLKLPNHYKSKEIEMRSYLIEKIKRGKIDFSIQVVSTEVDMDYGLNLSLIETYYKQLQDITEKYNLPDQDYLQTIIKIPNVIMSKTEDITDEEYSFVIGLVDQAVADLDSFRSTEGQSLRDDLEGRVNSISDHLNKVIEHEAQRKIDLQTRLTKLVEENVSEGNIDQNRLEQEIIYYLEKLDIHEEKVRLQQHCDFFLQEMSSDGDENGRKLNFISQEMGREINTLGSKAQHSLIQQLVVEMKVELDQIKEQLANVL